jgi:hypothetical protein
MSHDKTPNKGKPREAISFGGKKASSGYPLISSFCVCSLAAITVSYLSCLSVSSSFLNYFAILFQSPIRVESADAEIIIPTWKFSREKTA